MGFSLGLLPTSSIPQRGTQGSSGQLSTSGEFYRPCTWGNRGSPWDPKGRWSSLTWGSSAAGKLWFGLGTASVYFHLLCGQRNGVEDQNPETKPVAWEQGGTRGVASPEGILSLILRSRPLSSPHVSPELGQVLTAPATSVSASPLSPLVLTLAQQGTHSETLGGLGPALAPGLPSLPEPADTRRPTLPSPALA